MTQQPDGTPSASAREVAMIVGIGVLWGLNWPLVKLLLAEFSPWSLRAIGLSAAAAVLMTAVGLGGDRMWPQRCEWGRLVLAGLFTIFGFNLFTAFGQLETETSKAAIIAFTMPVWAALISALWLGEAMTARLVGALALGMTALGLLIAEDPAGLVAAPAGPLFMLGAAVSWALGTVLLKRAAPSLAPLPRAAWMVAVSAPPAVLGAALFEAPWQPELPSAGALGLLVVHVLGPLGVCYAGWSVLVARLPVTTATIGTLIVPVVGVLSAGWLVGDSLGPLRLLALVAVGGAVVTALRR
ncbi:MAG: DMT family transporter [Pseudomonadota bacterium]